MRFNDEGIIIGQKKYGENSAVIKVFSQRHGIYRGFVNSIKSSKAKTIYQIGNLISFEFRLRLEESLGGFFSCDIVESFCTKIMFDRLKLHCVNSLFAMLDGFFLEREEQEKLFLKLKKFLQKISSDDALHHEFLANYIKLELKILETLGYGIDLSSCAVTGLASDLTFVSPKSARAVSSAAARNYEKKLLKLPNFLLEENSKISNNCLLSGLDLTGFFINKFLLVDSNETAKKQKSFYRELIKKSVIQQEQAD